MKVKIKEEKNGTCAIGIEMFDSSYVIFFNRILATWKPIRLSKRNSTHRHIHIHHTHTHTARDRVDDYI